MKYFWNKSIGSKALLDKNQAVTIHQVKKKLIISLSSRRCKSFDEAAIHISLCVNLFKMHTFE